MPQETEHNWNRVANELKPQGYCEIQDERDGFVYHGPVESVTVDEDENVRIRLKWVAQMGLPGTPTFGKWVKGPDEQMEHVFPNFMVPFVVEPTPEKGPRIRFALFQIIYLDPQASDEKILQQIS